VKHEPVNNECNLVFQPSQVLLANGGAITYDKAPLPFMNVLESLKFIAIMRIKIIPFQKKVEAFKRGENVHV